MLFNSIVFIIFCSFFLLLYKYFKKATPNIRWLFITACSFFFYGWWDWHYLFLIVLSGLIDFIAALYISQTLRFKSLLLALSIGTNLLILALFKYAYFFCGGLEAVMFSIFGFRMECEVAPFFSILPIGISFYTFQSMSYTIDVYYGRLKPTENVIQFFAFLSFFPQLVAGPIVRAGDLLPQLEHPRPVTESMRWRGLKLIAIGYFKKTVLADNIGPFVNNAFANETTNNSSALWWVVMVGFAFQIYCDFSGYTDIARGLAKWMGIHFRLNFIHPYMANSFRSFWQRWHVSLSTWFRDYVYKPLGGSKVSNYRTYLNLWITMLISGLWHGAGMTFLAWGAIHAFYLTVERLGNKLFTFHLPSSVRIPIVFVGVVLAWVFFRAESLGQAITVLRHMLLPNLIVEWGNAELFKQALYFILLAILIEFFIVPILPFFRRFKGLLVMRWADVLVVVILILSSIYLRGTAAQFVYFQF
jgi:D-alanyl-lipoteichoic acid acyltransferase DltB (MBOAT superfamily)